MCDYSLMSLPNRLARRGEELVTHMFHTGTMGLACPADLRAQDTCGFARLTRLRGLCLRLRRVRSNPFRPPLAVCIPPGCRLLVRDISEHLQRDVKISRTEEAIFAQIHGASGRHRDALRFDNGSYVLLQRLREGQRVRVLDLSLAEFTESHALAPNWLDREKLIPSAA
jgi:hypothetical protein